MNNEIELHLGSTYLIASYAVPHTYIRNESESIVLGQRVSLASKLRGAVWH